MATPSERILREALLLDVEERAEVAEVLLASLESEVDFGVEAAWDQEIERRIREMDAGAAEMIPWSEVRRRLHRESA